MVVTAMDLEEGAMDLEEGAMDLEEGHHEDHRQ